MIVLPLSFYAYSKKVTRAINYLGSTENCTIRCVFPAQQQLEPSIDICRAQCNAKQWPSNDQRISCWNHCGGPRGGGPGTMRKYLQKQSSINHSYLQLQPRMTGDYSSIWEGILDGGYSPWIYSHETQLTR